MSKSAYEIEKLLLKGKARNFASLEPQQCKISLVCNFLKATVEAKYLNLEIDICPRWESHK